MMMKKLFTAGSLLSAIVVSGCGLTPATGDNPNAYIAVAEDRGFDKTQILNQRAAIAYDPDGCQNWIIDDGVEGYSSPRFDPATGMANVCNNHFPPGAVVGEHQSPNSGMRDWIPNRGSGYAQGRN